MRRMTRAAFETFLSSPPYELDVTRWPEDDPGYGPGQYINSTVQFAWKVWQEAQRQVREEGTA